MGLRNRAFPRGFPEGARGGYGLGVVPCTPESLDFGAGVAAKCAELLPESAASNDGTEKSRFSARVSGGGEGGIWPRGGPLHPRIVGFRRRRRCEMCGI